MSRVYSFTKRFKNISQPLSIDVSMKSYFNPCKSYIVTGGLGGLGLEMCMWMVKRGARNIIMTSRHGLKTGYQKYVVQQMEDSGCKVDVTKFDIRDPNQTKELLQNASQTATIGGIFHLAAVCYLHCN